MFGLGAYESSSEDESKDNPKLSSKVRELDIAFWHRFNTNSYR